MSMTNITVTISIDSNRTIQTSGSLVYRVATASDCHSLAALINNSYGGELSRQGWVDRTHLFSAEGRRTNENTLFNMINSDTHVFLVFFGEDDQTLKGCISLQHKPGVKTAYIGMFAVRPDLQSRGYGKFILSAAENYAMNNWNAQYIELSVITQIPELISYYERRGYTDTGQRQPYPAHAIPPEATLRDVLELCFLSKCLKKNEEKPV
ncbi:unnamed protein product [Rotaria sordida]|uniref:N-acetyltransferase domain-containing protein n=1 Tax=Rotaria sordida TaxID=392033 RepID=A0A819TFU4_9BILA|nr:unnamed protein product [Rotaria sordida]CAF1507400.1 unnamed protein product [Rotaria sordida]CAF4033305.1 unnamed protein product [Rotaria sordida]CAF4080814.1 unnamed protein product [Rotaria sordida]